ncbi:MAG: SNF2-related protein, partial [Eubacteriales bacterium]
MAEKTVSIRAAAELILSRCDGAVTLDGAGYNRFDSYFMRSLMEKEHWSPKQERAAYKVIKKYTGQLRSMGVEYDQIAKPPAEDAQPTPEAAREPQGPMNLEYTDIPGEKGKRLVLHSYKSFRENAKAIPKARWNPDLKVWHYYPCIEVMEGLLPYLTDKTIKPNKEARDILVELWERAKGLEKVKDIKESKTENISLPVNIKPFSQQIKAYQIGMAMDRTALLMEQRTGKTLSAIAIAGYRHSRGEVNRLLVICPLTVSSVWIDEFEKASFIYEAVNLTRKHGKKTPLDSFSNSGELQVAVINHESSWRLGDQLKKWKPDMVIVDESQKIKNGRAKQSKFLHKLGDEVKYKLILTGTPISQGPLDIWSQYRFLDSTVFGRSFVNFRKR